MIPELLNGTSHGFPKRVNTSFCNGTTFGDRGLQRTIQRRFVYFLTLRAVTPFSVNNINAIAKKGNAKPTKGETTGMGTCKDVSERGGRLLRPPFPVSEITLLGYRGAIEWRLANSSEAGEGRPPAPWMPKGSADYLGAVSLAGPRPDPLVRAQIHPLVRFVRTLKQDLSAVESAVSKPWSNGPVEGHINRLKMLKRKMYGRAGIELLCARLLPEPALRDP